MNSRLTRVGGDAEDLARGLDECQAVARKRGCTTNHDSIEYDNVLGGRYCWECGRFFRLVAVQ